MLYFVENNAWNNYEYKRSTANINHWYEPRRLAARVFTRKFHKKNSFKNLDEQPKQHHFEFLFKSRSQINQLTVDQVRNCAHHIGKVRNTWKLSSKIYIRNKNFQAPYQTSRIRDRTFYPENKYLIITWKFNLFSFGHHITIPFRAVLKIRTTVIIW